MHCKVHSNVVMKLTIGPIYKVIIETSSMVPKKCCNEAFQRNVAEEMSVSSWYRRQKQKTFLAYGSLAIFFTINSFPCACRSVC
jgi:hypothetical protein